MKRICPRRGWPPEGDHALADLQLIFAFTAIFRSLIALAACMIALQRQARSTAVDRPTIERVLERLRLDGFRNVVVHAGTHALLAITLDGGSGHGDYWDGARGGFVRIVVPDKVRGSIAVN